MTDNNVPAHLQKFLGDFGVVERDGGNPVSWGYPITAHMGEDQFEELRAHGRNVFLPPRASNGKWFFVTHELTPAEAEAQYGPITAQECGPKGGFRSITYGTTIFYTRWLRPAGLQIKPDVTYFTVKTGTSKLTPHQRLKTHQRKGRKQLISNHVQSHEQQILTRLATIERILREHSMLPPSEQ